MGTTPQCLERVCSLCSNTFEDNTPTYCRPCTNAYNSWRYHQKKKGLPTTIREYRRVHGLPARIPVIDDPTLFDTKAEGTRLKVCPICTNSHHNPHSRIYCAPCKSAYAQWARKRRAAGHPSAMAEFKAAVDNGSVRPRHEDMPHLGRVVRSI